LRFLAEGWRELLDRAVAAVPPAGGLSPDVFVSYSRDEDFVRRLDEALQERGKVVWVDWEEIPPTADWRARIFEGILAARANSRRPSGPALGSNGKRVPSGFASACARAYPRANLAKRGQGTQDPIPLDFENL
jgi:hypothetical protein